MVLDITIIPPSALLHYSFKWVIFPVNNVVHLLQVITVLLYNQKIWRYRGGGNSFRKLEITKTLSSGQSQVDQH
jgi:hypothetical protein